MQERECWRLCRRNGLRREGGQTAQNRLKVILSGRFEGQPTALLMSLTTAAPEKPRETPYTLRNTHSVSALTQLS